MAKTKNKQTIIGKETYINNQTGELKEFRVVNEEENTDYGFQKIWVDDLVKILLALGGTKVKVFCYILDKKNSENIFIGSIGDIAKKLKISLKTVSESLKIMKELDCIRMVKNAVYQISPNLIVRGKSKKRQILLSQYKQINN